jgi:glycosyltransferase involved in cell wall biosynthesis
MILKVLDKVTNVDLVIGHNPGAMYPSLFVAKEFKAKSVFDFEDYHRGELSSSHCKTNLICLLEEKCIMDFDSITTASPLITEAYTNIFHLNKIKTINNCFPIKYASDQLSDIPYTPLKLFWFSQHIGKDRGLEYILKAIKYFSTDTCVLSLLGNCTDENHQYFTNFIYDLGIAKNQVIFLSPVNEEKITKIASQHHIGIASEIADVDNRDYCLTNKIFMYLLSGNAILMSDTKAQKRFWKENSNIGLCYEQKNVQSIIQALAFYISNPAVLADHRGNALALSKDRMNWDIEQQNFIENIERTLHS